MTGLNDIRDIPFGWRELLAAVQAVCPTAVLAGGCLRDRDNGRPVKDLDIFIFADSDREAFGHINALTESEFEVSYDETYEGGGAYPDDQNLEVIQIAALHAGPAMENLGGLPVQLIFTRWDTSRIVERFDYGICRLSFDGENIVRPLEYDEDREAQVFRLRRDRPTAISMRGSIRRYARLVNEKYEGWDWWPFEQTLTPLEPFA